MNEVVREFLLESHENLAQLDLDLVTLEKDPGEKETIARVFRTLHTVKGTAGFLGLEKLQGVSHAAENLLVKVRAGELRFSEPIANAMLGVVDAIRAMLSWIESTESEGDDGYPALIARLEALARGEDPAGEMPAPAARPPSVAGLRSPLVAAPANSPPAPEPPPTPEHPPEVRAATVADSAIRVDIGLLDKLMNVVGELVLARNQLVQHTTASEDGVLLATVQRVNLLATELQAGVMKTRMQPVGTVWSKFPRLVRDLAVACGKQVKFEMEGQETELDKTILEAIRDPLTHMVRNAVDHGIESPEVRAGNGKAAAGRLWLHAFHEGGKVVIEIGDDGGGIDPQRVRDKAVRQGAVSAADAFRMSERELVDLVFKPGFSTAEKVTQFSGRGVGMDVVRTNIERIGGAVDIDSRLGHGAVVRMKIPLTLAIVPALTVSSGGERFAIPQVSLVELVHLDDDPAKQGIERIHGAPVFRLRGNLLPLAYLDRELNLARGAGATAASTLVVLQADDRQFGLVVDAIHDTQEIVVKPLQQQLKGLNVYSGATIMGDGQVALILDVAGLAQRAGVVSGAAAERTHAERPVAAEADGAERISALLFAGPDGRRMAIALDQVSRLEEFPRGAVERVGRREVVQYRGEILPLAPLWELLDGGAERRDDGAGSVQVVVHRRGGRSVGLAIGRILDIVEETLPHRAPGARPGIGFSAVVQGKVTEFLDLDEVLRRTALLEGAA